MYGIRLGSKTVDGRIRFGHTGKSSPETGIGSIGIFQGNRVGE